MTDFIAHPGGDAIHELARLPGGDALAGRATDLLLRGTAFALARVDPDLRIALATSNLAEFASDPATAPTGRPLTQVMWELVGMEDGIDAVLHGTEASLQLPELNRPRLDGSVAYVTLELHPLRIDRPREGLLLLVRDTSAVTTLTQQLTQQSHDLELARAELTAVNRELERLATTDALTGLGNRRAFDSALARELDRSLRFGHSLGLLLVDVDRFKLFNDTYGHPAGDMRLQQLGRIIHQTLGPGDVAARYGGEEFAVLLTRTDAAAALVTAQTLGRTCAHAPPLASRDGSPPQPPLTVSIGVASAPQHSSDASELVRKADQALYRAKQQGRNRCELCDAEANPSPPSS